YAATQAQAGDTVYIKGGNYGHEHVVISNSGTSGNPIVFEGYDGMPLIDGQDRTGNGIHVSSKKYIEIKNIKITHYNYGVRLDHSDYITLDGIIVTNLGGVTSHYSGWGIRLYKSDYNIVKNSIVTDARAINFHLTESHYNLLDNVESYGIETGNAVDYYIVIQYSHDNIVRNSITENKHRDIDVHPGHGIGIKDNYYKGYNHPHSYNNTIIDSEAHGHGENFFVAHGAYNNEFINVTAYNDDLLPKIYSKAFRIRDGAHNNRFTNIRAIGTRYGAFFDDTIEAEAEGIQITRNNIFTNCIFDVTDKGVYLSRAEDNIFTNCVFTGSSSLFGGSYQSGNILKNSIVFGIPNLGISGINMVYSNFWNNGFSMPAGTGN
ncbi:MAG: right-handed parallel beta-helix repeat-containing protein, partial [Gammaproteobacteria bacterium]|nr:right-handed parallel beta-helix repeat-containing protein [Gammaproteobacteria bacterium]